MFKARGEGVSMEYGLLISSVIAMFVVFVIDTRQKIRQHTHRK
jgi:hypothetical protein